MKRVHMCQIKPIVINGDTRSLERKRFRWFNWAQSVVDPSMTGFQTRLWKSQKSVSIKGKGIKAGSQNFDFIGYLMCNAFDNAKGSCLKKLEQYTLARWKNPEDSSRGTARVVYPPSIVSDLGFSGVKSTYS